ncbi:calcium-binding protein [Leptolyngbya sp. 7M]|uniref:calcium-binding protein n=1 Tax=Leptolyngbya sp. 7M TaxID=2812896 RepID=UPI001B8CA313|nr:calcium-binding protein [Leptolyngbya sp. 7M]QYO62815.1 hypothetical protein JVX88_22695 [Leptolyngbya sp. 7M]
MASYPTIYNDTIFGTAANDTIDALAGNDTVFGGNGDDKIYGNAGNDVLLYGDYGNDTVYGGTGNDNVIGSWGNDYLYGESGNDVIGFESTHDEIGDDYCDGGSGDDKIYSGTGNDTNYGGYGFDIIYAGAGNDYVNGGHYSIYDYSSNYLYGEAGNDYMVGGYGYDYMDGGADNDTLVGMSGSDTLIGGFGNDNLFGGDGDDFLSIIDPPAVPAEQNGAKQGLNHWNPGMLWSGFGVSDQWNDQHYFYGYYLSTAALVSLLDGCWSDTKPAHLWSDPDQMGTAIDQWLKTLVYDPTLDPQYFDFNQTCQSHSITYSKYAFFDQWNGHPWAAGVSPGRAGDVSDGSKKPFDPWSVWMSYGTGNFSFDDENENSTWEGLQAYSAAILWGAGSNRKAIVDQGIYLLTTGNAASDLYFLDKNYNLKHSSQNQYTWCPLTTGTPASQKDGDNHYPTHTGFVDACPTAFYGDASAGCSILQKGSPSLNNFFYAFPTGSKFIQAYPPTPWTMGMTRNPSYMQQWADVFTRAEWTDARNSALFQAGNWLGMAMTSSLCGVPYNPGDDPTKTQPYVDRVWSSWNVVGQEPGSQVTGMMQPSEQPTSVLNLLHVIEEYGTPDWSIYAKVTDQTGAEVNEIVFTAAFTQVNPQNSSVTSTLVAFNPGWETRYVLFYRLAADGNLSHSQLVAVNNSQPIAVPPKKMVVVSL